MDNEQLLESIENMIDRKFKEELTPIREDIHVLKEDVGVLKEDVRVLKEDVRVLKEDVRVLKEDVSGLKKDVRVLQEDVRVLKEDVSGLKKDVRSLTGRVNHLELTLENETNRNIRLIAEGHLDLSRKFDEALKGKEERELILVRLNSLECDVRKIKSVVTIPA